MSFVSLLCLIALASSPIAVLLAIRSEERRKARDQSRGDNAYGDVIHVPVGARNSIHFGPNLSTGPRNVLRSNRKGLHDA